MLNVENLNVYYGNIHAIKDVSLKVNKGEVVSLIGANGAGKTTTLQAISSLLEKRSGKVSFENEDITNEKAFKITRLGIAQVPEGRRVFSNLSVLDNISLGSVATSLNEKEKEEKIKRIYKLFPVLKDRKDQKAGTLSGGEQQMLAMARAIMTNPKLLLLDEPSMGLSPLYVEKIFETIKILKEEGSTILLVEQNANLALDISDRAYVLETGKIVKEDRAENLKNDPVVKSAYLGI
ncbi:ABC transporter ATP-binding protein [Anaerococcus hydrogenalis]|uniref:High-affinity branched-chain amino acid ABC transporter, ATP-binding protein LivF n=1 Tax=Anaerococcus hydrogenalis ACS-025-V-Sch4 TaxID=879306 RepID=F0H0F4_9FIRM|nr:ABC transporter ATP-binding protein [Anaerococcus hydrogenalis]EGC84017.1 high-affinity branched-chain amino acid ABC transporter, ATP-binding protein LivF [Anaerococcus hydrogenalis ACS-025-V-Sch4]MBS5988622.1 ABC transporter ATP-binding protein [Anaerococcus hydrogenalis]